MAEIVCLDSFIKTMKIIESLSNLDDLVDKEQSLPVLSGSSSTLLNKAEDAIVETVLDIELSAGYYLFDDVGLPIQSAIKKLNKNGFDMIKLSEEYSPFRFGIKSNKFCVLVS